MSYVASLSPSGSNTAAPWENRQVRPGRSVHLVKPGENLADIARQHGASWHSLLALNSHQLGANGAGLQPGMRLEI